VSDRARVSERWQAEQSLSYRNIHSLIPEIEVYNTGPVWGSSCAECEVISLLCCYALLISLVSFKGKLSSDLINHSEIFHLSGTGRHGLGSAQYPHAR
jgi:hypothetical protein